MSTVTVSVAFGPAAALWEATPGFNETFLENQRRWFNDRLGVRGHFFLNEVYDNLGVERTRQGAVAGWLFGDSIEFDNMQKDSTGTITFDMEVYPNILEHLKDS